MKPVKSAPLVPADRVYMGMFDLVKGLFMLGMVLLHASGDYYPYWAYDAPRSPMGTAGYTLLKLLLCGMVPMFFLICGYSYRKKSMRKAISSQLGAFRKPYLLTAAAAALLTIGKKLLLRGSILDGLRYQALPYLLGLCPARELWGLNMDSIGPIWFFLAYTVGGILLNCILQEKQTWIQAALAVCLSVVGLNLTSIPLPWCLNQAMICTIYLYAGWLMKKTGFLQREVPLYLILPAVIYGVLSAYTGYFEVSSNMWVNGLADVFAGLFFGTCLLAVGLRLNRWQGRAAESVRRLGREAMPFCCIHTVCYNLIPWDKVAGKFSAFPVIGVLAASAFHLVVGIAGCAALKKYQLLRMKKQKGA